MSQNYVPHTLPRDAGGNPIQLTPPIAAIARTNNDSVTTGTAVDVTLNAATSLVAVSAITAGLYMRFSATVSSSNFDRYIQAGSTDHFIRPDGCTTVSFIADGATAKLRLVEL